MIWQQSIQTFKPPKKLKVSEWADNHRVLTSESSAEAGQWKTSRAEYQRGIMDTLNDRNIETIVIMSSAQVGKTEILLNILGYHISHDPAPMLVVMPTLEMARAFSTQRLSKMITASHALQGKVKDSKSRDSGNTILSKSFGGGFVVISGSNSPASLSSRPCRIVLLDEVDRYQPTPEGDPVDLARKRTSTFWNRKIIMTSTPTIDGMSRIQDAWNTSDQRKYHVPCPHCNTYQHLEWSNIKWDEDLKNVNYVCKSCGVLIDETDKPYMMQNGKWVQEGNQSNVAGFHLNELYSSWRTWKEVVESFLIAKNNPEQLRVWVNTSLGECFAEKGEEIESDSLLGRRENYDHDSIPKDVLVLTCGVDCQSDRLEAQVVGWSADNQIYVIEYKIFWGDPNQLDVWKELDEYLLSVFIKENNQRLKIAITCIDSGYATQSVYGFVKARQGRRVFAIKGQSISGKPIANRPTQSGRQRVSLYPIGTDTAKDTLFSWLNVAEEDQAGYIHFPSTVDEEYFKQLTAEKRIIKFQRGQKKLVWKQTRERNESLDTFVYALAGFYILSPNMNKIKTKSETQETEPKDNKKKNLISRRRRNHWVNDW